MTRRRTNTVVTRDLGWLAISRELKHAGQSYVGVGVFGGQEADGTSLPVVAAANEYGVPGRIPERSFLRSTMDASETELKALRQKLLARIVDGKLTVRDALSLMGLWIQKRVQAKIRSNIPPPNAESTARRKRAKITLKHGRAGKGDKSDLSFKGIKTLIDTGQLVLSVTYEVGEGSAEARRARGRK